MAWWLWIAGGLLLVIVEAVTPSGFFILFFGLGALTVGALSLTSLVSGLAWQGLLFTVLSVVYLLLFRGRLLARVHTPPPPNVDSLIGVLAVVGERLAPGVVGRVEVRGAAWSARNTSTVTIEAGQRCRVVAVDGLLLAVVPE
jgi:membrane protein implicated in regulation of membrane protease activity